MAVSVEKDLYSVLGVSRSASDDEIRKSYRRLAKELHPDRRPGDKPAEERFKEVTAAHEVLSDPKKRKLYDEFGMAGLRDGFNPEQARAYQAWSQTRGRGRPTGGFSADDMGGFDLSELFGDMFRQGRRGGRPGPAPGEDLFATVEVDLAQALRGIEVQLRVPVPTSCSTCGGSGRVGRSRCPACNGTGVVGEDEAITVRIPKGADDGSRLRVGGRGLPGQNGGARGDLIIETKVKPHPHFTRDGLDLRLRLPITLAEAYNGASVEVPTPTGEVRLKIPARSQQGQELRLRGKGVARGNDVGDLYVVLDVRMPDRDVPGLGEAVATAEGAYSAPLRQGLGL